MKILITGGAGFIGCHLAKKYLQNGNDVYIIDDLSTGKIENIKMLEEINKDLKRHLEFHKASVCDKEITGQLVGTCDQVIHLAASVGVQQIIQHPLSSLLNNIKGTESILKQCLFFDKKVLIASTSEVYGKRDIHDESLLREDDDCVYGASHKMRWSYAVGKLVDEFEALGYFSKYNLPVVVTRFFNTVGPRQTGKYGMVLPRFVKWALSNQPIQVYGDGDQMRTFTHVDEVVSSLITLMNTKEAEGKVINIGGAEEISIIDLAKKVIELTESKSIIECIPYSEAYNDNYEDMKRRKPCTEKLKKLTGWEPKIGIDEIILDIVKYYKDHTVIQINDY